MHRHIIVNLQIIVKKMEMGQIINCIKKKRRNYSRLKYCSVHYIEKPEEPNIDITKGIVRDRKLIARGLL